MIIRLLIGVVLTIVTTVAVVLGVASFSRPAAQLDNQAVELARPGIVAIDVVMAAPLPQSAPDTLPAEIDNAETVNVAAVTADLGPIYVPVIADATLYAGPDSSYRSVGQISTGDAVMVEACNLGCTWYQINTGAWVSGANVARPLANLPVKEGDALNTYVETPTATPEIVSIVLPTVTPLPTATPLPTWTGAYAADVAILRSGPGTAFDRVSIAMPNEQLIIVAQNVTGDWYQLLGGSWIAVFLVNDRPREVPIAADIPAPPADARDLDVLFSDPRYDCVQSTFGLEDVNGMPEKIWMYRSFHVDMRVTNLNTAPLLPVYTPSRWIITDGTTEFVSTTSWQRSGSGPASQNQRILYYEDSSSKTWYVESLERDQWVKAVEFDWNGQTYREEFGQSADASQLNYKDCGEERSHTD